ncbi:MAG: DUF4440 domain-containing protein [Proteobacteria bacterium]|nr:MAG: DUF4440 domain-containing protein [Pseudomonadota bacterium]
MVLFLEVLDGIKQGSRFKLSSGQVIGRKTGDIVIEDEKISGRHAQVELDNKQQFVEAISTKKSDFVTITLSEQVIRVSGKTAIVRHKLNANTNDNGKPSVVYLGVLQVWLKESGTWKLFCRQAHKLDPPKI